MKKIIKKVFIIIFTSLMLVSSVSAANFKISGSGNPSPSGASGKNRNYPATDHTTLSTGVGLKLSLVKMSDNGPHYVSYYYYLINNKNFTTSSTLINGPYFTSSCGGGAAGCNRGGAKAVYGNINNGNYTIHSVPSPSITTYAEFDILDHTAAKKNGSDYGFNVSAEKVKKAIMPGGVPNDLFYKMITPLFRKDSSYRDGSAAAFPSGLNYDDNNTVTSIKDLLTNPNNSTKAAALNDYRIIIEPIYNFQNLQYRGKGDIFATLKTIAKVQTGEELNLGLAAGLGGLTGDPNSIFKNFFTCDEDIGIRNDCNNPSYRNMADVKSGLGYMIITITDKAGCNPSDPNGKVCCYDAAGTYHKEFSGNGKKETYKCTTTPNADKSCPGVGTAVNALTTCYKEEDKCPEITLADGTIKGTGVNGTTTPFVHNYYFVDKIPLANYTNEYNKYCNSNFKYKQIFGYENRFYDITGYTCDEYGQIMLNSSTTSKTLILYNENFEPYKIFDNIAKQQGLSVTNYEVIGARQVSLSTNVLSDFYKTYINLRNAEKYYYTDNAGNYFIASSNPSFIDSRDSLVLDYKDRFASDYYYYNTIYDGVSVKKIEQNSEQTSTYVKFDITKNYNTKNFKYYSNNNSWYRNNKYAYHPIQYRISYCLSTEEKLPSCDDDVDQADCEYDDIGTKAQFHENDSLSACTLNNKAQSGFSLVNAKETQADYNKKSYCEVACKDDFDIELPTTKHAVAGRYFKLDKYIPKLSVKRTCVTTNMNYDEFAADLESAKNDMIKAYNDWQDYKEYYNHLVSDVSYGPTISGVYEWTTHSCGSRSCGKEGKSCCGETHYHECNYSYNDWSDSDYTATNGNQFSAKSGTKGKQEGRNCPSASSSQHLETARENAKTEMNQKQTIYNKSKSNYEDLIGKYNKCSSWVNGQKMDFESGDKKLEVFFSYEDEDSSVFPTPKKLTQEKISGTTTTTSYWNHGQSTDENYTTGIKDTNANNHKQRPTKVVCEEGVDGKTCNNATNDKQIEFIDSPYIMRTEEVSYQYKLPTVYTLIPNGTVTVNLEGKNVANYKLDEQAAPVNINTPEDSYEYTIQIQNVEDAVRQQRKGVTSNTKKDNFEDRFYGKTGNGVLTKNNTYICDYEVINDIYLPKEMVYNSKTGKLNFFYRVIDMDNINPNPRSLGYNWNTAGAQTVKERMKDINSDYQKLVGNEEVNGKTSEKFELVLTPQMMRAIREYNGTKNDENNGGYSDWDLTCTNGSGIYHCESSFLTCLAKGDSKTSDCSGIFEDNVLESNSKVSGYNFENLQENRSKLIKKLQELGQR